MDYKLLLLMILILVTSGCLDYFDSAEQFPDEFDYEEYNQPFYVTSHNGELAFQFEDYVEFRDNRHFGDNMDFMSLSIIDGDVAFEYEENEREMIYYEGQRIQGTMPFDHGGELGYVNYTASNENGIHNANYENIVMGDDNIDLDIDISEFIRITSDGETVAYSIGVSDGEFGIEDKVYSNRNELGNGDSFSLESGDVYHSDENTDELLVNGEISRLEQQNIDPRSIDIENGEKYYLVVNQASEEIWKDNEILEEFDRQETSVQSLKANNEEYGYVKVRNNQAYIVIDEETYGPYDNANIGTMEDEWFFTVELEGSYYLFTQE